MIAASSWRWWTGASVAEFVGTAQEKRVKLAITPAADEEMAALVIKGDEKEKRLARAARHRILSAPFVKVLRHAIAWPVARALGAGMIQTRLIDTKEFNDACILAETAMLPLGNPELPRFLVTRNGSHLLKVDQDRLLKFLADADLPPVFIIHHLDALRWLRL